MSFTGRTRRWSPLGGTAEFPRPMMGIIGYRQALTRLRAELDRARRYQHPLASLVVSPEFRPGDGDRAAAVAHYFLGSMLSDGVRQSDIVTYSSADHAYALFLPECGSGEAQQAASRLDALSRRRLGWSLRGGVASFPADAFTLDALVDKARERWTEGLVGPGRPSPERADAPDGRSSELEP